MGISKVFLHSKLINNKIVTFFFFFVTFYFVKCIITVLIFIPKGVFKYGQLFLFLQLQLNAVNVAQSVTLPEIFAKFASFNF